MANVLINKNPSSLAEYIGNENIKEIIAISINACKMKKLQLGHMLITGQRGTGKTTLATLIAKELKIEYRIVSAEAISTLDQLNDLIINNTADMIIIDEIHRIKPKFSDMMHQAMDDFKYSFAGEDDVMITVKVHPFILAGCTTDEGKLTRPFYSRFAKKYHLEPYSVSNLQKIIMNVARNNRIDIDSSGAYEIARRSNHIPRIAVLHFQNVYEYSIKHNNGFITHEIVCQALDLHDIDEQGLDKVQRDILNVLSRSNATIGIENLAQRVGIGKEALVEEELYLLSIGFIERTKTGRKVTNAGEKYITNRGQ